MKNNPVAQITGLDVTSFSSVSNAADWIFKNSSGMYHGAFIGLNAEKVTLHRDNPKVLNGLAPFSIFYPDGTPIVWMMDRKNIKTVRIPGVELWVELMQRAGAKGLRVYLLGASEEINQATAEKLSVDFSIDNIMRRNGYFNASQQAEILNEIVEFEPHIVTVALGSPRQEKFITDAYTAYPDAFYMDVGGTYDVFTGKAKRAPPWMRENGLEFLYRFLINPSRIGRYLILFKFLYLFTFRKI